MPVISNDMDRKVLEALVTYSEYQVARMYNLRVGAVRAIKMESLTGTQRLKDSQLDLFVREFSKPDIKVAPTINGEDTNKVLLRQMGSGITTGHALLDMLNQHEIYNPEQLAYALNFDQRIEDHIHTLTTEGKLLLLRQLSKDLYEQHINPGSTKPTVSNS